MKLEILGRNQTLLHIVPDNGPITHILFSYNTPVAAWVSHKGYLRTAKVHSRTTQRHIHRWLESRHATIANTDIVAQSVIEALLT